MGQEPGLCRGPRYQVLTVSLVLRTVRIHQSCCFEPLDLMAQELASWERESVWAQAHPWPGASGAEHPDWRMRPSALGRRRLREGRAKRQVSADVLGPPGCQMLLLGFARPLGCVIPHEGETALETQPLPHPAALVPVAWCPFCLAGELSSPCAVFGARSCHPGASESLKGRCSRFLRGRTPFGESPSKPHLWVLLISPFPALSPVTAIGPQDCSADALRGCQVVLLRLFSPALWFLDLP